MASSYLITKGREEGIKDALGWIEREFAVVTKQNPNVTVYEYDVLTVENARIIAVRMQQTGTSSERFAIIACDRLFADAQNALLKILEEPPIGTYMFLVVRNQGTLLPTLLSRLTAFDKEHIPAKQGKAEEFLSLKAPEKEKYITKLLARIRADKETEKQAARSEALELVDGIMYSLHTSWKKTGDEKVFRTLSELERCVPILNSRAAPFKQIFEHLLLTLPKA